MRFIQLLLLIFIAIFLTVLDHRYSYLETFRKTISTITSPLYFIAGLPTESYKWISERGANKENLLGEKARVEIDYLTLKAQLQDYNALRLENQKLKKLLNSSYQIEDRNFTLAKVTKLNLSRLKKQVVIDKGSVSNLEEGQVVIGANGLVGRIQHVQMFFSTVAILSDPAQHIPVENQRNGIRGIAKGVANSRHQLIVNFIESDKDVVVGDVFHTSAIDNTYPRGFNVGVVTKINKRAGNPFLEVRLSPLENLDNLEFILIQ